MSAKKYFSISAFLLLLFFGGLQSAVLAQDDFEEFQEEDFQEEEFQEEDFGDLEEFSEDEFAEPSAEPPVEAPAEPPVPPEPPVVETPEEELLEELPLEELKTEDTEMAEEPPADSVPDLQAPPVSDSEFFARPASDDPNLEYERYLHEIYTKFHSQKTPEEDWNSLVGERQTESYNIERGDNLWNISKTFFGDGDYWPKIWSLNTSITNPHLINPDNMIRFVLGDESGPPVFTVTETSDAEEMSDAGDQTTVTVQPKGEPKGAPDEPEIPPPLVRSRPVLMKIPPSFPPWQTTKKTAEYDEVGFEVAERKIAEIVNKIPLASYVVEEKMDPIGIIHEVEMGSRIASALQYLYVLIEPGTANVGDTLVVFRNTGEVESVHPSISGFLGYSIEIQGELQLVERLPGSDDNQGRDLFRAVVSRVVNPVTVGSSLRKARMEFFDLKEEGPRAQVVAQIVGGQYFNRRQVYGSESIAFLNRGTNHGLAVGQILSIRENRMVRNSETAVRNNVRPIGWLKVVKVTPNLATAVVLRSWSDIVTGDVTGAGDFETSKIDLGRPATSQDSASNSLLEELDSGK